MFPYVYGDPFGIAVRRHAIRDSKRQVRMNFDGLWECTDGQAFLDKRTANEYQVRYDDIMCAIENGCFWLVGFAPILTLQMSWMSQEVFTIWTQYQQQIMHQNLGMNERRQLLMQMLQQTTTTSQTERNEIAKRILGQESELHADQYGHVSTEETTTSTTTSTNNQKQARPPVDQEMVNKRYQVANLYVETGSQNGVPEHTVAEVAKQIRAGQKDTFVLQQYEKMRSGQVKRIQKPAPAPVQTPAAQQQYATQTPALQQQQYGMQNSLSERSFFQEVNSPLPQQLQPRAPVFQPPIVPPTPAPQRYQPPTPRVQQQVVPPTPGPMYGGQQGYVTHHILTVTTSSSSSGAQTHAQPMQSQHMGYGQIAGVPSTPMPQGYGYTPQAIMPALVQSLHQSYGHPAQAAPATRAEPQLMEAPHEPEVVANFSNMSLGAQYPGSPQPAMAYPTQQHPMSTQQATGYGQQQPGATQQYASTYADENPPTYSEMPPGALQYAGYGQYPQGGASAPAAPKEKKKKKKKSKE